MIITQQAYAALCELIHFAAAGACGRKGTTVPADWEAVFRLAHEHQVVPLIGCALLSSPDLPCPESYREYALNVMRGASSSNLLRKQRILHLLRELKENGIKARIIKGYAAARFYAFPECREAGDTDLLIDASCEKQVNKFLSQRGFQLLERSASSHHTIAAHPKFGKIEMHVSLYNEIVEDIWFQDIDKEDFLLEADVTIMDHGSTYETLGNTDHLIFITLHMIKHFIGSGLTLRMLLDTALYFSNNRETIDTQRFWYVLERLKYTGIVNGIFSVLVHHGGFSAKEFPGMTEMNPEAINAIIEDLFMGGYMGIKETYDRHTAAMIYNRKLALKQKSKAQYLLYMVLWKMKSATTYLFPSKELLLRLYPIVKQYPGLAPVLRTYQLAAFPIRKLMSGIVQQEIRTEKTVVAEVADRRMKLFKQLGMI